MNDTKKSFIIQSLDSLMPLLISMVPENVRDKHIFSIVHDTLKNFNTDSAKKLAEQLVYENTNNQKTSSSPFSTLIEICKYLETLCVESNYSQNVQTVKQLNTILLIPSSLIIEKNIEFKLANLNITETIRKSVSNGYTYEMCDRLLHFIHTMIFKFLSLKISDLSISELARTVDEFCQVDQFCQIDKNNKDQPDTCNRGICN